MYGLETIKAMNEHPLRGAGPAAMLDNGDVFTVIWSLFTDDDDHIRTYCTEVCTDRDVDHMPSDFLDLALNAEGFATEARPSADLLFVLDGGCIVHIDQGG